MDGIFAWTLHIGAVAIVISLFEMLLPDGNIKKFARTGLGLVMMLAILKPLIHLVLHTSM